MWRSQSPPKRDDLTPQSDGDTPSAYHLPPSPTGSNMEATRWGICTTPTTPSHSPKTFISNFLQHRNDSTTPEWRIPATPSEQLPIIRISGGYSSLWVLFIAGATPIASSESQAFVLRSLERIATEFGINQARVFATALRTKIQLQEMGISKVAEEEMVHGWDAGWYEQLGEKQKVTLRNAALKGGEGGIAPVYMPRIGPHVAE
jgi:hypothetical protein